MVDYNHTSILHGCGDMEPEIYPGHIFNLLGSCDVIGRVTVGLGMCGHTWSIITIRLSCIAMEITNLKLLGSRTWPFGIASRHRSRDLSTRHVRFPIGAPETIRLSCTVMETLALRVAFSPC